MLLETHSDHVMDGVRIAIREGGSATRGRGFSLFTRMKAPPVYTTPQIDAEGRLSEWPEGFFDQHRSNMARLVKPRTT